MIPSRDVLERTLAGTGREQEPGYTPDEIQQLEDFRPYLDDAAPELRWSMGQSLLRTMWPDTLDYIRKTHVIKTKRVGERVLFKPNFAQRRFYEEVAKPAIRDNRPIRCVNLKARQLGFSTFYQSLFYEWCDRDSTRTAMTVSYSAESTLELFQKTLFVRRNQWFARPHRRDRNNILELNNDSTFFARTAGTDTVGRGDTYHYLHCSEVPMWPDADEAFTSLMQAVPDQPGTCVILESTARGAADPFYEQWRAAGRGESEFVQFFAPWHWNPEYRREIPDGDYRVRFSASLDLEERRLAERFKLDLEQLFWRRWCIANNCQGSTNKFKQEYPSSAEEAFLTTGSPCFDAHAVAQLADNSRPALWTGDISLLRPEGGASFGVNMSPAPAGSLRLWDHPIPGREYVIGADVAEGRVRDKGLSARRKLVSYSDRKPDYSAACVIELETGLHVGSWHGTLNPYEYATVLYAIGQHFNNALLVVEVNGPGIATITCLAEQLRYPRLYRTRQYAVMENPGMSTAYGWRTLPQTREQLMFRLTEALAEGNLFTRDGKLIDEMRTMVRDPNGQPRAMGSNKDDRVFGLALALQGKYDVFGGRQERPGATKPAVHKLPDSDVWAYVNRVLEQSARARSQPTGSSRPPRHLDGRASRFGP